MGDEQEALREPVHVDQVLAVVLDQLAGMAWQRLGLHTDPVTGKAEPDLAQARKAIDAVDALGNLLMPALDDEDRRQLANLRADLKANYLARKGDA